MVNNTIRYFVQKSGLTAPSASVGCQIFDPNASTYIQDGQILVTNGFGNALTNATVVGQDKIFLQYRLGDTIHQSAELTPASITSYKAFMYRPELEQSTIIGYNATNNATGNFVNPDANGVVDDTVNYMVTLFRNDDDSFMGIDRPKTAIYYAGSNPLYRGTRTFATQQEVVNGLADIIYKEFIKTVTGYQQVTLPIKVERICSYTGGTKTALGQTLTVANESPFATAGAAVTLAKGTLISIAGKMYVVAETCTASTKVVLDVPYQGVSATAIASGVTATTVFTYAPAATYTDYWGLQITGKSKTFYKGLWKFEKVRFNAQVNEYVDGAINSFGINDTLGIDTQGLTTIAGTPATVAPGVLIPNIEAFDGVGTYQSVNENEWANLGFYSKEKESLVSIDRESKRGLMSDENGSTCKYSIVNIQFNKQWTKSTISVINDSGNIIVAVPLTSYTYTNDPAGVETIATDADYGFVTVLDAWLTATEATNLVAY